MTENNPAVENETGAAEGMSDVYASVDSAQESMELFLAAADVHAVFAEPIQHGENLIIPAAEVLSLAGFGYGSGGSNDPKNPGGGGGGGGGGRVFSRPVAVIVASQSDVEVKPVFDLTKIALAGITAFGFMFATLGRMKAKRLRTGM